MGRDGAVEAGLLHPIPGIKTQLAKRQIVAFLRRALRKAFMVLKE
tara:strand:- start:30191 stop:30325 length:135 start_codon:yes stop_codon:yes gene_type:complete